MLVSKIRTNKNEFPRLMSDPTGAVYLMIAWNQGVVVSVPDDCIFPVGSYSEDWEMELLSDYDKPVLLGNGES